MHIFKQVPGRTCWIVGHRGAMGYAPENTLASFQLAQSMGADFVECDVHLSKDKECIVIHDESVERTTNGFGLIRDLNLNQIRKLDAGSWYSRKYRREKVPLLKNLLNWVKKQMTRKGNPMGLIIEIKNEPVRYLGIAEKVAESVLKTEMQDRVVLISFDHGVVKRIKKINKHLLTGILYNRPLEDPIRRAKDVSADALFPRRNLITKKLVQQARDKGLVVATWTVNEPAEMKKIIPFKLNAIASNFPDLLNRMLSHKRGH